MDEHEFYGWVLVEVRRIRFRLSLIALWLWLPILVCFGLLLLFGVGGGFALLSP